jgi:hypothetical protein
MKTTIFLLLTITSLNGFTQTKANSFNETKKLLDTYYPGNEMLQNKVMVFYDSLSSCSDTTTVDWLVKEQEKLSLLLSKNFVINEKEDSKNYQAAIEEAHKHLSRTLMGFEFHINSYSDAELEELEYEGKNQNLLDAFPDMELILDQAHTLMRSEPNATSMKIENAFKIIFDAWGPVKYGYTTYCYDVCCDCAQESALGSGLHSKLLTAIVIYTAHSNLFSEALTEIKKGIKNDVLYTHSFSSPKKAILAEFAIIKPLLDLSKEEELIYEKKRLYLEETSEEGLRSYGR